MRPTAADRVVHGKCIVSHTITIYWIGLRAANANGKYLKAINARSVPFVSSRSRRRSSVARSGGVTPIGGRRLRGETPVTKNVTRSDYLFADLEVRNWSDLSEVSEGFRLCSSQGGHVTKLTQLWSPRGRIVGTDLKKVMSPITSSVIPTRNRSRMRVKA